MEHKRPEYEETPRMAEFRRRKEKEIKRRRRNKRMTKIVLVIVVIWALIAVVAAAFHAQPSEHSKQNLAGINYLL